MTISELINHLENISKETGTDALVAIDVKINDSYNTRSEIFNLKVYGTDSKLVTLEANLAVMGSVEVNSLVNKRINELVEAANDEGILV